MKDYKVVIVSRSRGEFYPFDCREIRAWNKFGAIIDYIHKLYHTGCDEEEGAAGILEFTCIAEDCNTFTVDEENTYVVLDSENKWYDTWESLNKEDFKEFEDTVTKWESGPGFVPKEN